jgi:hypothetical protein
LHHLRGARGDRIIGHHIAEEPVMRFPAFYMGAGVMCGVGAVNTTIQQPLFGLLFAGAILLILLGALFEACNS